MARRRSTGSRPNRRGAKTPTRATSRTSPKRQKTSAPSAGQRVKAGGKALIGGIISRTPLGVGLDVYNAVKNAGGSDKEALAAAKQMQHKRRHGIVNKRARKTIGKAMRYYKQLRKLQTGIEKMARKAGVKPYGKPRYFRKKWRR